MYEVLHELVMIIDDLGINKHKYFHVLSSRARSSS